MKESVFKHKNKHTLSLSLSLSLRWSKVERVVECGAISSVLELVSLGLQNALWDPVRDSLLYL